MDSHFNLFSFNKF